MTGQKFDRRGVLMTAAFLPMAGTALAGCSTLGGLGGFNLVDAVKKLLSLSSQRAFASLLQPGGFYDNQAARVALPGRLADNGNLVSRILTTQVVRDRLQRSLNSAAEKGAERAAPAVVDAIRSVSVADAAAILRGGPSAATSLLEGQIGSSLVGLMFPAVGDALRLAGDNTVSTVLRSVTGYDVASLARDVTDGANRGIWSAMGAEEAQIRANPQATGDPLLIGALALT